MWIMLWYVAYLANGGVAAQQAEFKTLEACNAAVVAIKKTDAPLRVVQAVCVRNQ